MSFRSFFLTALALAACLAAAPAAAQTDYYNTDAGRPITVEDAYATERYAFELQLAPLRIERARGGVYKWEVEPEIAYGIFPRTHIELGFPISFTDARGARSAGLSGVALSALHNLNAETSFPALGVAAEVLFPVGPLAYDDTYGTVKGIATRSLSWARFHLNGAYTLGSEPAALTVPAGAPDLSRWMAGIAVDRTFPLRALLITAETVARQPMVEDEDLEWSIGAGARYQMSPTISIDGGVGKAFTGDEQAWYLTFGLARAFGIRSLFPVGRVTR